MAFIYKQIYFAMILRLSPLVLGLFILVVSCDSIMQEEAKFFISNPTTEKIQLAIDQQNYVIEPDSSLRINLSVGVHTLILPSSEEVKFSVSPFSKGGIINPTLSTHVIYALVYSRQPDAESEYSMDKEVMIDSVIFSGPIETTNHLFIDNVLFNCTYWLSEPFPESISRFDSDLEHTTELKFFTKKEFIDFIEQESGEKIPVIEGGETEITVNSEPDIGMIANVNFVDPKEQEQALALVDIVRKIVKTTDRSQLDELHKELHKGIGTFVDLDLEAGKNRTSDIRVSEAEKYNSFMHSLSALSYIGIGRVLE